MKSVTKVTGIRHLGTLNVQNFVPIDVIDVEIFYWINDESGLLVAQHDESLHN